MNGPHPLPPNMISVMIAFPLVLVTLILAFTPRTRRGVVFGISLPLDAARGSVVTAAIRRYQIAVVATGLAGLALMILLLLLHHSIAAPIAAFVAVPVLMIVALAVRAHEAARLHPLETNIPVTRTAELTPSAGSLPFFISLGSFLALAAAAVWLHAHRAQIPARWPRHWDTAGHVNGWGTRSTGSVMAPLALGAAILLLLIFTQGFMTFAPGPDARQRRRFLAPMAALAWLFALFFCGLSVVPLTHPQDSAPIFILICAQMVGALAIVIWIVVRSGVFGVNAPAMAEPRASTLPDYDGTPDRFWHAGLFYWNPRDSAVIVPKRFGIGWTFNFARPLAWLYIGIVLAFVAACALIPFWMH